MPKKKSNKLLKFVCAGDIHWGYSVKPGDTRLTPTHAPRLVKPFLAFVKDFQPDVLALMGDQIDCFPVSRHLKDNALEREGQRLRDDIEEFDKKFLSPLERVLKPDARRIWLDGNHEAWADQLVAREPGLRGLVAPRDVLRLKDRDWEIKHQGYLLKLGKWKGAHGDVILGYNGGRGTQYPAMRALNVYGSSVRLWHTHMYQSMMREVMADESYHTAVCVPGMCNRAAHYAKNAPNRFAHGFCYGYVFPDGLFQDYIVVIWKDRFVVDGKVYQG